MQNIAGNKTVFFKQVLQKPGRQIVEYGNLVSRRHEFLYHMASDVARTAYNQYVHIPSEYKKYSRKGKKLQCFIGKARGFSPEGGLLFYSGF